MREGVEEVNLWDQVKHIPGGMRNLADWIGEGGTVVDPATSQHRADICLTCALNKRGSSVTTAVALAVRAQLEVKNKLKLRVKGEKQLRNCDACGCVLRLLVHEPQERVESQTTYEEAEKLPGFCWKKPKQ